MTSTPGELVGLPEGGPTSLALVKAHLKITDTRDDTALTTIVAAVNNLVRSMAVSNVAVGQESWPDRIVYGATMLAGRLFRRKNSPAGVESFGQLGAAYVMRNDPDIAQLLELGSYQNPQVG
jgi:Phage QLRG family, putative DNA packaging.